MSQQEAKPKPCPRGCGAQIYWRLAGKKADGSDKWVGMDVKTDREHFPVCPKQSAARRGTQYGYSWVKELEECDLDQANGRLASGVGWELVVILPGQMGRAIYVIGKREQA